MSTESTTTESTTVEWIRGEIIGRAHYRIPVYLALNKRTGELFAAKQVEIRSGEDDDAGEKALETLKWESKVLKNLDHPNIVQYLGCELTPSTLSVFLEYMPGGSLADLLTKYGEFEENLTKFCTSQILDGLQYLHSQGIIHFDLKGAHILVGMSGKCKISGFGISRREGYENSTADGAVTTDMLGTIFWMAPEVVNPQGRRCDAKADIWSLGCTLLEMWTGQRPWMGEEMVAVMFKLYSSKLSPPLPGDVVLSDLAEDFRKQCFIVDPDQRPSAAELRNHGYLQLSPDWILSRFGSS